MSAQDWSRVLASLTPTAPEDIDGIIDSIAPLDTETAGLSFPKDAALGSLPMEFADPTTVCFGARITEDLEDPLSLAVKLAQLAVEKDAHPIILSHVPYCGLERFGFRVERVVGETEAERTACEAQLRAFWKIVILLLPRNAPIYRQRNE